MASALAALRNATAVFTVAGSGTVTDAVTGNVTPTPNTVRVSLYVAGEGVRVVDFTGVDTVSVEYTGYAVAPQVLDRRIVRGTTGTLTFDGETMEVEVLGVREKYGATGLIGSTLRSVLGDPVRLVARGQR